jgi:predicted ATPase/class 3 adenylate cyclase/tRNA A-37 threonylcarbamoyl transferase component Bud32
MPGGDIGPGSILGARYELRQVIGSGGMAQVWRASDLTLGRTVAVKLCRTHLADQEIFAERFRREARHTASLTHPNIVAVYDWVVDGETALIVMELVEGPSLRERLEQDGTLSVAETIDTVDQLLAGLHFAHEHGIVHRDIKPANVLIGPLNDRDEIMKLGDFGIASALSDESRLTQAGVLGTPSYLAPELARGDSPSVASDLYAMGCLMYECLVGTPPFLGRPEAVVLQHLDAHPPAVDSDRSDIPADLARLIRRALEKDPRLRPEDAAQMRGMVRGIGGRPPSTTSDGTGPGTVESPVTESSGESPRHVPAKAPSGAVTLLFTDIVGSTRAWELHPTEMRVALARHDELLRSIIEQAGGFVFKTVGDAFFSAFSHPTEAVGAAIQIQRLVAEESWPVATPIQVRSALHSGVCDERDGDYFGPPVNRVARLQGAAHGGQVVVSGATAALIQDSLPEGTALRDLGEHRLKDLGRPERVFQIVADGLLSEFPPLRSLDNPRFHHNLPEQITSFVGREKELAELLHLLGDARLLTLTGPGGVGKTRLALQLAAEMLDGSGDGVWLADLAPLADPELVAVTVGNVLGIRQEAGRPVLDALVESLRDRNMLVLLDNCEHVIDATASLAERIVQNCGRVALLATSREPLGIAGEHVYRVPSLSLPEAGDHDPVRLADSEAVRLFTERAAQHRPFSSFDVPAVGRLCRRLDGIPLAIELATARLRSMSLGDLEARLDQRFRLLTGGSRTALPRQRTLEALIDWSYDLLSDSEKLLLARLSVFAGGFNLDAAESVAVGAEVGGFAVFDLLGILVDKSLVQADDGAGARTTIRFRLLETVRDYASAKLIGHGESEVDTARKAHRDHYLALAEASEAHLIGADQVEWLDRLEQEYDNLRIAFSYSLADPDPEPGLRLGAPLEIFWQYRGYGVEGASTLDAQLDRPGAEEPTVLRGRALVALGRLLVTTAGDYPTALSRGKEALAIGQRQGDDRLVAQASWVMATARLRQGQFDEVLDLIDRGLTVSRALDDSHLAANFLNVRGQALEELGRDPHGSYEESLRLFRQAGDRTRVAVVLNNIGVEEMAAGNLEVAGRHLDESLQLARELGDHQGVLYALQNLGLTTHLNGDDARARVMFAESLDVSRRNGDQSGLGYALLGLALTTTKTRGAEQAAMLHGAVDALFDARGEQIQALESRLREADHQRLRTVLGSSFESTYRAGRALSIDELNSLAIS